MQIYTIPSHGSSNYSQFSASEDGGQLASGLVLQMRIRPAGLITICFPRAETVGRERHKVTLPYCGAPEVHAVFPRGLKEM